MAALNFQKKTNKGKCLGIIFCFRFAISCRLMYTTSWKIDLTVMMSSIRDVCGSVLSHIPGVGSTTNPEHRKVLCVGLACLDSIHVVKAFPVEDTDVR
jgi:hypothetical protein